MGSLAHGNVVGEIGLAKVVVILKITWDAWRVVSATEPGDIDQASAP